MLGDSKPSELMVSMLSLLGNHKPCFLFNHLADKNNVVADCLSRAIIDIVSIGIDYTAMAKAQIASEEIQAYRTAITNLMLADMPV